MKGISATATTPSADHLLGILRDTTVALVRRDGPDPADRRSVLVQRTIKGTAFLRDLRSVMAAASGMTCKSGRQHKTQRNVA